MGSYVEKMALKVWEKSGATGGGPYCLEETINQIIADTKAACLESIRPFDNFSSMHHSAYVEAIEKAEVKEQ